MNIYVLGFYYCLSGEIKAEIILITLDGNSPESFQLLCHRDFSLLDHEQEPYEIDSIKHSPLCHCGISFLKLEQILYECDAVNIFQQHYWDSFFLDHQETICEDDPIRILPPDLSDFFNWLESSMLIGCIVVQLSKSKNPHRWLILWKSILNN